MKALVRACLGILLAVVLALALTRQPPPPEPVHEGKAVSAWALQLNSPSASLREKAAATIRGFGADAVPPLVRLLNTPDPVLAKPVRAIGPRLPNRMSGLLFRMINPFEAPFKRASAAQALRTMGANAAEAVPALRRALADDRTVSWHSALALAQMGGPGLAVLTKALSPSARLPSFSVGYACYALSTQAASASNAIPPLTLLVQTGPPEVAEKAARALGNMGSNAVPSLVRTLRHQDLRVRLLAINALGSIGLLARDSLPVLAEVARTDELPAREAAVDALAQIRPTSEIVVGALAAALKDQAREVRLKAVQGLSLSPRTSVPARPALIALLKDQSPDVRGQSASLLGEMGGPPDMIIPALLESLNDENEVVRAKARQALEQLERAHHPDSKYQPSRGSPKSESARGGLAVSVPG